MTKAREDNSMSTQRRPPRKSTIWTRDKIAQLIELYRRAECLWNYHNESYKCKESRNKSIVHICTVLNVSKHDYGKKIHNLRNQFNSEMKKLERRIEESGGSLNDDELVATPTGNVESMPSGKRCRWDHFEALMFLRQVIEPRPGYQTSPTTLQSGPQIKKRRTKMEFEDDHSNSHGVMDQRRTFANTTDSCLLEDTTQLATVTNPLTAFNSYGDTSRDRNYATPPPPPSQQNATATTPVDNGTTNTVDIKLQMPTSSAAPFTGGSVNNCYVEQNVNPAVVQNTSTPTTATIESNAQVTIAPHVVSRDQWDAFGETIANEFRNLNSEFSRKRLKRKIMQAMLEVGAEDDSRLSSMN